MSDEVGRRDFLKRGGVTLFGGGGSLSISARSNVVLTETKGRCSAALSEGLSSKEVES
jgi:hypothetical protein